MILLPSLAAIGASFGWASGSVLAQTPARQLGTFEFTRIQLLACGGLMALVCSVFGQWGSLRAADGPAFAFSILFGIILGNLAMIECIRCGGARRTELLLALKAPLVAVMAFVWLGDVPGGWDLLGAGVVLSGLLCAILWGEDSTGKEPRLTRRPLLRVIGLGVAATACQGFGYLVLKPALEAGVTPLAVTAVRLLGAAFVVWLIGVLASTGPASGLRGQAKSQAKSQARPSPGLLAQAILPGVIGYGLSSSLLLFAFAHLPAGVAAVLGSLSPVLVLPVLWLSQGHRPRWGAVFGAGLCVIGTGIIGLL